MVTTFFDGFFININHKAHKYEKMKKSRKFYKIIYNIKNGQRKNVQF